MGKNNNQALVSIPHAKFFNRLTCKCELVGIKVILTEECYTSKCSFLDLEPIAKQAMYAGKRIKRGLFVSITGENIHADINGSYNMIRKVIPCAFCRGIEGLVVDPCRFSLRT
jgi:putative transposase